MNKGIAFIRGLRGFPFLVWKRNLFTHSKFIVGWLSR